VFAKSDREEIRDIKAKNEELFTTIGRMAGFQKRLSKLKKINIKMI